MARKGGLGKGLDALIPSEGSAQEGAALYVPVVRIIPNPHQPRADMDAAELQELAASIREHGVLQPLLVTYDPQTDQYTLVAGERRWRASQLAGLETVPVIVRQVTDQERLELALIENVQRADLSPLEKAEAYRQLTEDFGLTHEEISRQVGKSREAVTNTLRLLKLPDGVRAALTAEKITEGHARALLRLATPQAQMAALGSILKWDLNVRQTEELVKKLLGEKPPARQKKPQPADISELEERLRSSLGTRVTLRHGKRGGSITIHYYSDEELDALIAQILKE